MKRCFDPLESSTILTLHASYYLKNQEEKTKQLTANVVVLV